MASHKARLFVGSQDSGPVQEEDTSLAAELLHRFFSESFPPEVWRSIARPSSLPFQRHLQRGLDAALEPDVVVLRRFKHDLKLSDYFTTHSVRSNEDVDVEPGSAVARAAVDFQRVEKPLHGENEEAFGSLFCGRTVSTYPHLPAQRHRLGEPICDHWVTEIHGNKVVMAVADGCGWGRNSREAAILASHAAVKHLRAIPKSIEVRALAHELVCAIAKADQDIRQSRETIWECGTATMVVGVLLPSGEEGRFEFICASVGDCKVYCYRQKTRSFIDITYSNRESSADPSDPGGRLGPYGEEGAPDLRNFDLYSATLDEGDLLIGVSDGVHDNLDPELLGITPRELHVDADKWSILSSAQSSSLKTKFAQRLLSVLVEEHAAAESLTPRQIVTALIAHAQYVTKDARNFAESQTTHVKMPTDYRSFPGKVDHTTCVAVVAGARYQGQLKNFQETQARLVKMQSELQEQMHAYQVQLERRRFELNMPLQITLGMTNSHIKLFCRTIARGELIVQVCDRTVLISVKNCQRLEEVLEREEMVDLEVIGADEFSFPIERSVELPTRVLPNDPTNTIKYDEASGLIRISLRLCHSRSTVSMPSLALRSPIGHVKHVSFTSSM